ncbi:MAG: DNA polymerase IV [Gemmatimonadaceae bacterium]|nr:DNA polymerase IV [Gemmatimonadaceae bacterium]
MPRILLVDADAFYVAVARMVDPEGAGQAELLIVGGSPESRGVVCSASYETRKYGVRSAMPMAQALRLCPAAMCVPVPRQACAAKSREIRQVLQRFTPVVEGASIDEWYLDLTGTERLYHDEPLERTAHRIRDAVRAETGFSVSVGGGTNKLVAKLAVEVAKPKPGNEATGVHIVPPGTEAEFVRRFALADIPLIGPKFQARLHRVGLRTVDHVLEQELGTLCRWFGEREGRWLYDRVRGIDHGRVAGREEPKSLSREDTFPVDIGDDARLERELLRLVTRAASDLRHGALTARTITVKLRDADFTTRQASRTLAAGVVADRVIYETARELLRRLRAARRGKVRLLGVSLSSLSADPEPPQLALFDDTERAPTETARDRTLTRVVDEVRARFGADAIVPGALRKP